MIKLPLLWKLWVKPIFYLGITLDLLNIQKTCLLSCCNELFNFLIAWWRPDFFSWNLYLDHWLPMWNMSCQEGACVFIFWNTSLVNINACFCFINVFKMVARSSLLSFKSLGLWCFSFLFIFFFFCRIIQYFFRFFVHAFFEKNGST